MKKQHVKLTESDKGYLESLLSKGALKVRVQKRAMGLQMLDKGLTYQEVSKHLKTTNVTLSKWAASYKVTGLDFLKDKPRSGRPIGLSGEERAKVTALACSDAPEGYARWSLRLLSDRLVELEIVESISHTEVGRILKKTNCSLTEKNNGASEN
jgi:transposase